MALDLGMLPRASLLELVSAERVEQLVKKKINWRIYQRQDEMMRWELLPYNTCVVAHVHRASRDLPWNKNPERFWLQHGKTARFPEMVDYRHNQAAIVGTLDDEPEPDVVVVKLHIAAINDDAIYLQEIALADPSRPAVRPLDDEQKYEGLGNGVFREILTNLRRLAGQHGRDKVILYAVDRTRAAIFAKKGFNLDTTEPDLIERSNSNGIQIPMVAKAL